MADKVKEGNQTAQQNQRLRKECFRTLTVNIFRAFLTTSASPKSMCFISSICDSFSDSHFDSLLSSSLYSCQLFSTSWSMVHLRCQKTKTKNLYPCENYAADHHFCSYLCSVHLHTFDQRSPRTASCSSRSAVALSLLLSSTTTTMWVSEFTCCCCFSRSSWKNCHAITWNTIKTLTKLKTI